MCFVAGHWFSKRYATASGEDIWSPMARFRFNPEVRTKGTVGHFAFTRLHQNLSTWFASFVLNPEINTSNNNKQKKCLFQSSRKVRLMVTLAETGLKLVSRVIRPIMLRVSKGWCVFLILFLTLYHVPKNIQNLCDFVRPVILILIFL